MSDLVHGGMFTVMVVNVDDPNEPNFESRLAQQVARSPSFFANAPVVVDLSACAGLATGDAFLKLKQLFKRQHLILVGIQNANATQVRAAMNADLAAFPPAGAPRRSEPATAPAPAPVHEASPSMPMGAAVGTRSRVVTQPVRSGTQIYARGGDLIVLASVSPGAEVLADGHVHIYGALRGRAIAGASGDVEARVYVGKLEAELLCVAGHYLVNDSIPADLIGQSVQVALEGDRLTLAKL